MRANTDNLNILTSAFADIYAALPEELIDWQARVVRSPISNSGVEKYYDELIHFAEKADVKLSTPISWAQRVWQWVAKKI